MALPIIEQPIYGQMTLETAAWSTPFTWVDRTASIVNGIAYSEGGRVYAPGQSAVDAGTLNATFKNLATAPIVGDLVRLRRTGTTEYIWTGYVQDVTQRIVFDQSVSYTTPVTLTTIICLDWVGYISQFQAVGAGGANESTGAEITNSQYRWYERIAALNNVVDPTFATKIIDDSTFVVGEKILIGDTDFVGSLAEHINLLSTTAGLVWFGRHVLPTNKTTGRTGLVRVVGSGPLPIAPITFTDEETGGLHYTEIDFENSTQNVANNLVVSNRVRFHVPDVEVTKIGGFNEENYVVVNNQNVIGIGINQIEQKSDATSVTTYGNRQAEVTTNVGMPVAATGNVNLIANPSSEYSDEGYSGGAAVRVRRRKPSEEPTPFTAYDGLWAVRARISTAGSSATTNFSGGEADGIPVVTGTTYFIKAFAARGTPSRADVRALVSITWFDDNEASISTSAGSNVTITTAQTWYQLSHSATAPANAVRARINVVYSRTGGGNHTVGDRLWADALILSKANIAYFDGDTPSDSDFVYIWTGGVGLSPSYKLSNFVDDAATNILAEYSTTSLRITRIRWNAQENMLNLAGLVIAQELQLTFQGVSEISYRIIGINGNISNNRYMIDYYLEKV